MVAERVGLMPGAVQVTFYADQVVRVQSGRMPTVMTVVATEYANDVKRRMRDSPATGRIYKRGKTTHQASAPGEPPAPDTGDLLRHVMWRVRSDGDQWFAEVGNSLPYALYLEQGAAKGVVGKSGRIESVQWILYPRPAWGPSLERMRGRVPSIIARFGVRKGG